MRWAVNQEKVFVEHHLISSKKWGIKELWIEFPNHIPNHITFQFGVSIILSYTWTWGLFEIMLVWGNDLYERVIRVPRQMIHFLTDKWLHDGLLDCCLGLLMLYREHLIGTPTIGVCLAMVCISIPYTPKWQSDVGVTLLLDTPSSTVCCKFAVAHPLCVSSSSPIHWADRGDGSFFFFFF